MAFAFTFQAFFSSCSNTQETAHRAHTHTELYPSGALSNGPPLCQTWFSLPNPENRLNEAFNEQKLSAVI